ncbi:DUF2877 domain-containing protein [Candidatus Bipolaricaulota bacterium]
MAVSQAALHPRAILLRDLPAVRPIPGSICSIENRCLHLGEETVIETSGAHVWLPESPGVEQLPEPGLAKRVGDAIEQIALQTPVRGVVARTALSNEPEGSRGARSSLGALTTGPVVQRAIASLRRVSVGRAVPVALREASGLVGLGEGLTPSGDDLLGGFLLTLRTLDSGLPGRLGIGWHHVEAWLRRIEERTNRISFSVLADHARGEASAVLSEFVHAVLEGSPQEDVVRLGIAVARVGHSSGWDMLAGVRCACLCATRILEDPCLGLCVAADRGQAGRRSKRQKEVVRVC